MRGPIYGILLAPFANNFLHPERIRDQAFPKAFERLLDPVLFYRDFVHV